MSSLDVPPPRLRHETIRRVIDVMVTDLIAETPSTAWPSWRRAMPMRCGKPKQKVVAFSAPIGEANQVIKDFLNARMYRHWRVNRMTTKARRADRQSCFRLLHADTSLLPDDWRARAGEAGTQRAASVVSDYIAGMTDRYAMDEHRRLTDLSVSG